MTTIAEVAGGQIAVPLPKKYRRTTDNYVKQGNEFAGYGKDKCNACGEPTRDHSMLGQCPMMETTPDTRVTG